MSGGWTDCDAYRTGEIKVTGLLLTIFVMQVRAKLGNRQCDEKEKEQKKAKGRGSVLTLNSPECEKWVLNPREVCRMDRSNKTRGKEVMATTIMPLTEGVVG